MPLFLYGVAKVTPLVISDKTAGSVAGMSVYTELISIMKAQRRNITT